MIKTMGKYIIKKNDGLTLLELIISITLIGIIALIITGALQLGLRSIDSGEKRIESLERIRSLFSIIDSQIQSEIPLTYDDEGERKYLFSGNSSHIQFATNYSVWGEEKGYVIATYTVESVDNGKQILNVSENIVGTDTSRTATLFGKTDSIYFEFFYKDPTEEEGYWIEEWNDEFIIPEKIKVHLVKDMREFSLIIPLRARGSLSQSSGSQPGLQTFQEE